MGMVRELVWSRVLWIFTHIMHQGQQNIGKNDNTQYK